MRWQISTRWRSALTETPIIGCGGLKVVYRGLTAAQVELMPVCISHEGRSPRLEAPVKSRPVSNSTAELSNFIFSRTCAPPVLASLIYQLLQISPGRPQAQARTNSQAGATARGRSASAVANKTLGNCESSRRLK